MVSITFSLDRLAGTAFFPGLDLGQGLPVSPAGGSHRGEECCEAVGTRA
jgi:hypothetical protein